MSLKRLERFAQIPGGNSEEITSPRAEHQPSLAGPCVHFCAFFCWLRFYFRAMLHRVLTSTSDREGRTGGRRKATIFTLRKRNLDLRLTLLASHTEAVFCAFSPVGVDPSLTKRTTVCGQKNRFFNSNIPSKHPPQLIAENHQACPLSNTKLAQDCRSLLV